MGNNLMLIGLHLFLLPVVFHALKYVRIEEIFKKNTPSEIVKIIYIGLVIAITQLVVQYFVTVFALIEGLF